VRLLCVCIHPRLFSRCRSPVDGSLETPWKFESVGISFNLELSHLSLNFSEREISLRTSENSFQSKILPLRSDISLFTKVNVQLQLRVNISFVLSGTSVKMTSIRDQESYLKKYLNSQSVCVNSC